MKKLCRVLAVFVSVTASLASAETNSVVVNAGADLRVRQEIMHNIPGLPGAPGAMMPRVYKKDVNHIRFRPRVWPSASWDKVAL